MMKAGEFSVEILLKGASKAIGDLRRFSAGIKDMRLGLVSAVRTLNQYSEAARQMAVNLDMYQLNTGLSGEQLQKLSFRAAQAGVSMEELGGTIQHLQNLSARANLGEGWSPVLSRFGIMPGQDPVTQLNKISAALKRLQSSAPAEARQLAHEVGLSDTMYYALMQGNTDQMREQLVLTQKEQMSLVKLNAQWNKFWFYLKQIAVKLSAISASLHTKFVKVLINASQGAYELLSRFYKLIEVNKGLRYAVIALGVALAAYFAPWLLVLSAIALALEDIFVYFEGGDSITGDIVKWCQESERLQNIWEGIKVVFEGIKSAINWAFNAWKDGMKAVTDFLDSHPILKYFLEEMGKTIGGIAKQAFIATFDPIGSGLAALGEMSRPQVANTVGGDVTVQTTVNMNGTANPREDGQRIADTVASQAQDAVKQMSYQTQTGGGYKYEPAYD